MPARIQRKRTRGWKMPEGAIYVGRPSRWGNPWRYNPLSATSRRVSVAHYRGWAEAFFRAGTPITRQLAAELRGHDLACWCPLPCGVNANLDWSECHGPGDPCPCTLPVGHSGHHDPSAPPFCHADVLLELANG